jgi:hypothetical protein
LFGRLRDGVGFVGIQYRELRDRVVRLMGVAEFAVRLEL